MSYASKNRVCLGGNTHRDPGVAHSYGGRTMWTRHITVGFCVLLGVLAVGQPAQGQGRSVNLAFRTSVYGKPCALDTTSYVSSRGQRFTLSTVKYYIGHVTLEGRTGTRHILADHVLIDAEDSTSGLIALRDIPEGTYTRLTFMVGVDSIHNTGGPLEGVLDPLNGMYWTWATGFIFVKVEGASPSSQHPKNRLEYHLGGFAHPHQNTRWVTLEFKRPLVMTTHDIAVDVMFDVGAWLDASGVDVAKQPTVTDVRSAAPLMNSISSAFRANR